MKIFVVLMLLIGMVMFAGCAEVGDMDTIINTAPQLQVEPAPPVNNIPPSDPAPAGMVVIPAGAFQMGSNDPEAFIDEQPVRTVHVNAFSMDTHEVTNAQYKRFVDANLQWQKGRIAAQHHDGDYLKHWNGNNYPAGKANHPVVLCELACRGGGVRKVGRERLPTEAEWEKAARGGLVSRKYPNGNTIDANSANYGNGNGDTTAVGRYRANGYGLYDMAGNVWEWSC